MSQSTNVLTGNNVSAASAIDFAAGRLDTLELFKSYGALDRKSSAAKKAATESAVAYMQAAKMDYEAEKQFKTDCVIAQAGKNATKERMEYCRASLNNALKLYPDYVAAIAQTPAAIEKAKQRGGAQSAADKKAAAKKVLADKKAKALKDKAAGIKVIKGKAQSAPQVELPTDIIRFDHIIEDVTRSMQGIHSHVQMHLQPSQLTDYNKAQKDFLITIASIVNK